MVMKLSCSVDEISRLTPDAAKALLNQDKKGEFLLLDVRQPEEYKAGHVPGAILIPLGELEARQGELDRSKKIITYCRSGRRSMAAAIALCGLGFRELYTIDGGILDWRHEVIVGIPEDKPELITDKALVSDILMLGIKLEKGSWDFYMAARDKVRESKTIDTLEMLAKAEEKHMEALYQRTVDLLGEGHLPPLEKFKDELKVEHMEGGIAVNQALTRIDKKIIDEMGALEIALEKEYLSYDFYKRSSVVVGESESRSLLHELANEERNHAHFLLKRLQEIVK